MEGIFSVECYRRRSVPGIVLRTLGKSGRGEETQAGCVPALRWLTVLLAVALRPDHY